MRVLLPIAVAVIAATATFVPAGYVAAADWRQPLKAAPAACQGHGDNLNLQTNRGGEVRGGARAGNALRFGNNPGNDNNTVGSRGGTTGNTNSNKGNRTNLRSNSGGDLRGDARSDEVQRLNQLNQGTTGPGPGVPGTGRSNSGRGRGH